MNPFQFSKTLINISGSDHRWESIWDSPGDPTRDSPRFHAGSIWIRLMSCVLPQNGTCDGGSSCGSGISCEIVYWRISYLEGGALWSLLMKCPLRWSCFLRHHRTLVPLKWMFSSTLREVSNEYKGFLQHRGIS